MPYKHGEVDSKTNRSQLNDACKDGDQGRQSNVGMEKEEFPQANVKTKSWSVVKESIYVDRECEQGE